MAARQYVLLHGHMREQREILEKIAERTLLRSLVDFAVRIEEYFVIAGNPARLRRKKPCYHPEGKGFSRARESEQRRQFAAALPAGIQRETPHPACQGNAQPRHRTLLAKRFAVYRNTPLRSVNTMTMPPAFCHS